VPVEPEEIGRIMESRGKVGDILEEERESRKSSENGVSIEGEYAFSMAISRYSKVATEEGRYKGSVVKNITEQLRMRARYEGKGRTKKYVAIIGASEIGRIAGEIGRMGEQVVMLGPVVRIRGE
jgi:hypothetical protein